MPIQRAQIRIADTALLGLPQTSVDTDFFWKSGADGYLRIQRCGDCGRYAHPPTPRCRHCGASAPEPAVVSGNATIFGYTINRHTFVPWMPAPYVLAIVALDEQTDVHLTTRLVDVPFDDVRIGLPVSVVFERHNDVFLPLFGPRRPNTTRQGDPA